VYRSTLRHRRQPPDQCRAFFARNPELPGEVSSISANSGSKLPPPAAAPCLAARAAAAGLQAVCRQPLLFLAYAIPFGAQRAMRSCVFSSGTSLTHLNTTHFS
jgi:hypothetical protein